MSNSSSFCASDSRTLSSSAGQHVVVEVGCRHGTGTHITLDDALLRAQTNAITFCRSRAHDRAGQPDRICRSRAHAAASVYEIFKIGEPR